MKEMNGTWPIHTTVWAIAQINRPNFSTLKIQNKHFTIVDPSGITRKVQAVNPAWDVDFSSKAT